MTINFKRAWKTEEDSRNEFSVELFQEELDYQPVKISYAKTRLTNKPCFLNACYEYFNVDPLIINWPPFYVLEYV
jgi:hypothetical protein